MIIENETDLKELVRVVTMYEDHEDELPATKLNGQVRISKLMLTNKLSIDPDDWYVDNGLAQALLFTVCINSKCSVENHSITRWNIGKSYIDVSENSDTNAAQFQEWADNVAEGLDESDAFKRQTPTFSGNYIGN